MMIGAFGRLTGYNGSFPFNKPGDKYGDTPYVGMRIVSGNHTTVYVLRPKSSLSHAVGMSQYVWS